MSEPAPTSWLNAPHQGGRKYSTERTEVEDTPTPPLKSREELVCNITYPGTRPTGRGDEFTFANEEKTPVVVLLGWTGCQDKNIVKFSGIYEDSCITMRCTTHFDYLLHRRNRLSDITQRVLDVIMEKRFNEHPIFFVVFSDGGAILYYNISLAMQKAGSPLKVKGVIFDSSPGERRVLTAYIAARIVMGKHPLNFLLSCGYTMLYSFCWLREVISELIGKANTVITDPKRLTTEPYSWPQMFLYSNGDKIVYRSDVEKFASKRANQGVRTQLVLFKESPHLKHLSNYRDIYISAVYRFMKECLAEQVNENSVKVRNEDVIPNLTKRIILPQAANCHEFRVQKSL